MTAKRPRLEGRHTKAQLNVRLTDDALDALEELVKLTGQTKAAAIEMAIRGELRRQKRP